MAKRKSSRGRRAFGFLLKATIILAAVYALSLSAMAYGFLYPHRSAPRLTPKSLGLPQEAVTLLTSDNKRLSAWHMPNPTGQATVVVCHGHGGNREQSLDYALFLYEAGFSVLAMDFRGAGESEPCPCSFGLQERLDVVAAVKWIRSQPGGEKEPIGVLGLSMGGVAAALATAEDISIQALVMDSCFARLDEVISLHLWGLPKPLRPLYEKPIVEIAERRLQAGLEEIDAAKALRENGSYPVFIIHGEEDRVAPPSEGEKLLAAAPDGELWVVPGGKHVGSLEADPAGYEERVTAFFRRNLRPEAVVTVATSE